TPAGHCRIADKWLHRRRSSGTGPSPRPRRQRKSGRRHWRTGVACPGPGRRRWAGQWCARGAALADDSARFLLRRRRPSPRSSRSPWAGARDRAARNRRRSPPRPSVPRSTNRRRDGGNARGACRESPRPPGNTAYRLPLTPRSHGPAAGGRLPSGHCPRACAVAVLPSRPARRPLRAEKCAVVSTIGGGVVSAQCRGRERPPPLRSEPGLWRRRPSVDRHPKLRIPALAAVVAGVMLLAAAAFVLSYEGIHQIALRAGVSPGPAKLYPLIFDAMLVVAAAAALALRGAGWWARF